MLIKYYQMLIASNGIFIESAVSYQDIIWALRYSLCEPQNARLRSQQHTKGY